MDFFILVGIIGKELIARGSKGYKVDYIRVRNLADGLEHNLTMSYIKDNNLKVLGIGEISSNNKSKEYLYSPDIEALIGDDFMSRSRYDIGILPTYKSIDDANSSKEGNIKIGTRFAPEHKSDEYSPDYCIDIALDLNGNEMVFSNELFDLSSSGDTIDCEYNLKLSQEENKRFIDYLINSGIVKVTDKNGEIIKIELGSLTIFNTGFAGGDVCVVDNNCKYLGIEVEYGTYEGRKSKLVINPDVKVISILSHSIFEYGEEDDFKMFISRKTDINTIIDLAHCLTFNYCGDEFIGFECFCDRMYYPGKLDKCKEITERLNSRDTSDKLFTDIDYLVKNLNEIGFNIELY